MVYADIFSHVGAFIHSLFFCPHHACQTHFSSDTECDLIFSGREQ